ncbi:Ferredoxin-type protein NapF [Candidatus Terasakiella magnetica]|uniref:Ferredoxin-type protein NapF n=1 Tax=Candidatus Terasakiella magnetica TaxID=1867952 RepID=A0A1C3RJ43_9PROT|nr:ferredoxin-type protein NapF [Candidatus Terasakiella magnetica]SCA57285.1 Ferredoxin-type protein NapF [Candidatus Terasakiella magnetica]
MRNEVSRRTMLFGHSGLSGQDDVIRPPWSLKRDAFAKKCTGCGECVTACPENILKIDERKLAKVDFSKGECTFCRDCVASCRDGALVMLDPETPWSLSISIEGKCLAMKGIECRACDDQCEPRAIRFRLTAGAVAVPQLDQHQCTGCGACVSVCPSEAIVIKPELNEEGE